ncbi:SET domain-containing protein [Guyanagaster necrorhizus]|uniref:SET domain-containing protein n=1 Tax=Guyanagaster necrorhizus TaxID=856835 RepID=A0A9P7VTB8_9AGAR|nr:SET domain-containing protein [Guyanagaster necrorhizus MCA 3950]KAG7446559.1 SET domain-containing protein [Guyanagaster necrorhizus MCA 3950]
MSTPNLDAFVFWFEHNGGYIDNERVGFHVFPPAEGGRGAIALQDIPEGHTLFTIPRSLVISTRTSLLPERFGPDEWKNRQLNQGWAGLILCMMWEATQGKWAPYLDTLPTEFDTPMFWTESDLNALKGTSVVDKLGKADAEQDYAGKVLPAIQSRPDLFQPELIPVHYSLYQYHVMGSRILSRSFNVEKWEDEVGDDEPAAQNSCMDVDDPAPLVSANSDSPERAHGEEVAEEDEEEEGEDASDISMVPVADLLNARYEAENAKLFYEENELKMVATKRIMKGEQIWNTYGDLPNAELLRRYGHVDLVPLSTGEQGNPGDIVEVGADLVVDVVSKRYDHSSVVADERIEWWLEEGGDDIVVIEADLEIPPALISLIKLLSFSSDEWRKVRGKGKPPKPKLDSATVDIIKDVLVRRLQQYPTSLQDDEMALSGELSLNLRNATMVRLGEKRILHGALQAMQEVHFENPKRKRDAMVSSAKTNKKARQQ